MRFRSVVLDADSTLAGLEGVDWLAARRGQDVEARVAALTGAAMAGEVPLESVYESRLEVIRPTRSELDALADAYVEALDPTAVTALARMRAAGVEVHVVSGGLREALLPMTRLLGVEDLRVHAVEVSWDAHDAFLGVAPTPLTTQGGKPHVVRGLGLARPILAVGDGSTDLALRADVDAFAAYVGFVRREQVARSADLVVRSMAEVAQAVVPLSSGSSVPDSIE